MERASLSADSPKMRSLSSGAACTCRRMASVATGSVDEISDAKRKACGSEKSVSSSSTRASAQTRPPVAQIERQVPATL